MVYLLGFDYSNSIKFATFQRRNVLSNLSKDPLTQKKKKKEEEEEDKRNHLLFAKNAI